MEQWLNERDSTAAGSVGAYLRDAADAAGIIVDRIVVPRDVVVEQGDVSLHVLDWGGAGEPILFLHGAGLTAHTWDLVCLGLSDSYRCLALDLRGHGDSDWSPDGQYSLEAYVADVERVVDDLGLGRFTLVGMSLGGIVALSYAPGHLDRLRALAIIDIAPRARAQGARRIADFMGGPAELESIEAFVERAVGFNPRRRREQLRWTLLQNLRPTPSGGWTWKYDRRPLLTPSAQDARGSLRHLRAGIPHITSPTLVVRGGDSEILTDEEAAAFAASLPDGRWVRIPNASHTVQGDQPAALVVELRRFLADGGSTRTEGPDGADEVRPTSG